MPFAHDWTIFYLTKNLGVVNAQILSTLGEVIVWQPAYILHLFNRLEQALRKKFGHHLSCGGTVFEMETSKTLNVSAHKPGLFRCLRKYLTSRFPETWCLQLELDTRWFYLEKSKEHWLVEMTEIGIVCKNSKAKHNFVKAINKILI
jgi:hypothetical protein